MLVSDPVPPIDITAPLIIDPTLSITKIEASF